MSDDIKAAAERLRSYIERGGDFIEGEPEEDEDNADYREHQMQDDLWTLACDRIALGERQEDRWTHQRASDGALSMFTFATPQAAANYFHSEKDGRIVRVSTFIREEGEGA